MSTSHPLHRLLVLAVLSAAALLVGGLNVAGCAGQNAAQTGGLQAADVPEGSGIPALAEVNAAPLPTRGAPEAEVTIVWFGDYLSPHSKTAWERLETLRSRYPDSLRVAFRQSPAELDSRSGKAARAVIAAGEQGKFWAMHDKLFANLEAFREAGDADAMLEKWAKSLELNVTRFNTVRRHPDAAGLVGRDQTVAHELGADTVPYLFVNGAPVRGAASLETLDGLVQTERKKVRKWRDPGMPAEMAYRKAVAANEPTGPVVARGRTGYRLMEDSPKIPVAGSPARGPADALVTIVEFSDFQCPFCQKSVDTLEKIRKKFPDQVRVVYKHYPLPFHKQARPAAYAAMAAGEQGKFWAMHDKLFASQKHFQRGNMRGLTAEWAAEMGLDVEQFKRDYDRKQKWDNRIERQMTLGKKIGVRGTPAFFVNGEEISGAQPYSKFKSVVEKQLAKARKIRESGTKRHLVYREAVDRNIAQAEAEEQEAKPTKMPEKKPEVNDVDVPDYAPVRGERDTYRVTVVMFSDFECPYCEKAAPVVEKLVNNYPDKVRLVYRHQPLPMHTHAKEAAWAAVAAGEQGKFWAMHDKLFANRKKLNEDIDTYVEFAKELGLGVDKFRKDYKSEKLRNRVADDKKYAAKIGARGTPTFFVNGVKIVGAQPYAEFENEVEAQLELTERLQKDSDEELSSYELYKAAIEANKKGAKAGGDTGDANDAEKKVDLSKLKVGTSPVKGPIGAPVTIYEFSDFECPFCKKAHGTLKGVLPEYRGRVRMVHKDYPLPFHTQAKPAARAAWAAQQQGKFWEMYDLLFDNQDMLDRKDGFVKLAKQIGLDIKKFKKDMNSQKAADQIDREMKLGEAIDVSGTPYFVIGDQKLVGAQPASKFRQVIEEELEEAEKKKKE